MDKKYWNNKTRKLTPYVPGEQPKIDDLIKLNTNENPYPPSPKVLSAVQESANGALRLYPDPESLALKEAIAKRHKVLPSQVFVGNGSDEVLAFAFMALFDEGVKYADITYSFYAVYSGLFGITPEIVMLNSDFTMPINHYFSSVGGVIIANPNAPTGIKISNDDIKKVCQNNTCAVVIDEAYAEFSGSSALELLDDCENLVIVKTFSKSHSLAGLRVGYAIASNDIIQALETVKNCFNSYPVDRIAQSAAKAAILDEDYYDKLIKKIVQTRESITIELEQLGFMVLKSEANFVFAKHDKLSSISIAKQLRDCAILVRRFEIEKIKDFIRITIGTDDEMQRLIYCLKNIIK